MQPTVAEMLARPELSRGRPRVVAGSEHLDTPVRWVHISEHEDIARLMYGGELVLTTGVAWPDTPETRIRIIEELADSGAAAVVIELVRKFHEVPPEMIKAAEERGLPLIGLEREIRFIDVTQAVHALIMDSQVTELQAINAAHKIFTHLSVKGATYQEVLDQVSELSLRPAVLENLSHQVTVYSAADMSPAHLLQDWETRSRRAGGKGEGSGSSWLVADVIARGQSWGRVVLLADDPMPPWTETILERAANTIALNRLVERDRATLERHAHSELLGRIVDGTYTSEEWLRLRSESLGVAVKGRHFVGLTVLLQRREEHPPGLAEHARGREDAERVAVACRDAGADGLIGILRPAEVVAVLSLSTRAGEDEAVQRVARAVHREFFIGDRAACTIGVGSPVTSLGDARRSLLEAEHAAESVPEGDDDRLFYRLTDVGISGLAHLLRDDPRLQTFVERMLSDLLIYDEQRGTDLETVIRVFLDANGNKTAAAAAYGLSRPAFYGRLNRIEEILGVSLDDASTRTSLHFALLALKRIRSAGHAIPV